MATTPNTKTSADNSASNFDKALAKFVSATKDSMTNARLCAEMAIAHFAEHGNTIWLQRFFDAMPQNWTRKQAFLKWAVAHSPLAMVNKKFIKDTSETAMPFNIEDAVKKPFWDFAPEMEPISYSADDLKAALVNLVKRYQGKRYLPTDQDAMQELARIEGMVTAITGQAIPHANDATTTAEGEQAAA